MKKFDIFVLALTFMLMILGFIISCSSSKTDDARTDTIFVDVVKFDTILVDRVNEIDSLSKYLKLAQDSVKFYRDSVYYQNYINGRRIEKIKYYINICNKNAKNKKYFFGWIKRTMTE